jgi:aryl-alcohol dehydrogenase-like predicted oxidoreductase
VTIKEVELSRFVIGTAQFGLKYGIANRGGQITLDAARPILSMAREGGISMLDTASLYGDSEIRLGEIGVNEWQIVTKLAPIPENSANVEFSVNQQIKRSLANLKLDHLHAVLLHRPRQLLDSVGPSLFAALAQMRDKGLVEKIGISIYEPDELERIWQKYRFDIVQAPLNIMDRRLEHSGWLSRLTRDGCEVHVRSIFLQGLLMMRQLPKTLGRWQVVWDQWQDFLILHEISPLDACLGYILSLPEVAKIVVGVDSEAQLKELMSTAACRSNKWPTSMWSDDRELLNPSLWPTNP